MMKMMSFVTMESTRKKEREMGLTALWKQFKEWLLLSWSSPHGFLDEVMKETSLTASILYQRNPQDPQLDC